MKFDDIIAELGEFGPYQKRMYILATLVSIPSAFQMLIGVFTFGVPDHRCKVPGLVNDTYSSQGAWHDALVNRTIPWDEEEGEYKMCDVYSDGNRTKYHGCSEWVYSDEIFDRTFVSDHDLICGDKIMRTYANMILMGGLLFGSLVMGYLSDRIGRRKVLILSITGQFAFSLSTTFAKSYVVFVILRFLTTFTGIGMFLSAFVIGMELVGPTKRKYAGIVIEMVWCLGLFIQNGVAYGIRDWRYLQAVLSAPTMILVLIFWWLLPESPRWLINQRRFAEAEVILRKAAAGNGVTLSEKALKLDELEVEGEGETIMAMFTSNVLLIRTLIICYNWLVASMVYYGLSLNVGGLSGDIYLNFFLSAMVEFVSYIFCLMLLDVWGRKPLQCVSMIVAGVACVATMIPTILNSPEWINQVLSLTGKFGASAAFAIIYVFSAELFPTVMRNSGLGISSFCARIGGVASPYIADLGDMVSGDFGVALPLLIFGSLSVVAGGLAFLLPETLNRKLPDTVEDAKNFANFDKENNDIRKKPGDAYVLKQNGDNKDGKPNPAFSLDEKF